MRPLARRLGVLFTLLLVATTPASAHTGHSVHVGTVVGAAAFLLGVVLLGASVYLDETDRVDPGRADQGVFAGLIGLVVGVALLWL